MPAVGDPILASDLLFARLTANQSLATSSTTLQNVIGLSVPVAANCTYAVECVLFHDNVSGTTEDVQYGFSFPSGASLIAGAIGGTAAGVSGTTSTDVTVIGALGVTSGSTTFPFGASGNGTMAQIRGVLVTSSTAGTFQVMAAQSTSGSNATRVRTNTHIRLTRVA